MDKYRLPELPYTYDALEPYISAETLEFHHDKHHASYVDKLNKLINDTEFEGASLEAIICKASGGIFNNGAQVWNHSFYWNCMSPGADGEPQAELAQVITENFGNFEKFKSEFAKAATGNFGSGWTWLVVTRDGRLEIVNTGNAGNPLRDGKQPLLTCDVWEHAYYIDYRNARPEYVESFIDIVNWPFVAQNLAEYRQGQRDDLRHQALA